MLVLIDTSVWIDLLKDQSGDKRYVVESLTQNMDIALSRFTQLEILQGARDEKEWQLLQTYLENQLYLEASMTTWRKAARIYFELRRNGKTVRSPIDCCIAQIAIDKKALLLHRDQDFTIISGKAELQHQFVNW